MATEKPGDKRSPAPPGVPPLNTPRASATDPQRKSAAKPRPTPPPVRPPDAPGDRGEDAPNAPPRSKSADLESGDTGAFQSVTQEVLKPSGETLEQTEDAGTTGRIVPLPRHADEVEYDGDLERLIRIAALVGRRRGSKDAVNYTTLLIGFALSSDVVSRWLRSQSAFQQAKLLESRNVTPDDVPDLIYRSGRVSFPQAADLYSPSARQMLDLATEIAKLVANSTDPASLYPSIGTRHLLAAFLFRTPANHAKDLAAWGLDTESFRLTFRTLIGENWSVEQSGWDGFYSGAPQETAGDGAETHDQAQARDAQKEPAVGETAPSPERARYVASFGSDDPSIQRRDLLDVKDEARAFARIAASRSTRLPLSIGVFGEWGSGKSFFMGLMHDHVQRLSDRTQKEGEKRGNGGDESLFLPDIVQIEFNAWHYIESNLWASLVEYIFSELDRKLKGGQKPREQVESMFEQLSTSRVLKLEAIEELMVKGRERKAAEERLGDARRDYEAALLRQSAATSEVFWTAVLETFKGSVGGDEVKKIAKGLGLEDLSKSASSLNEVLKEAETEAGRAKVLHRAMVAKLGQGWWMLAIALTLIVLPGGVVLLKDVLKDPNGAGWIAKINDTVLALSGMMVGASALVGRALHSARSAMTKLEGFRKNLDAAVKERTDEFKKESGEAAKLAGAEREIARLKNELEQAERKFAEADKRSDEVMRDYQGATARGRLNAFIRDKLSSGDYAKHLGLIATIRKDFEQLAQLMADAGSDGKSREKYLAARAEYRKRLAELVRRARKERTIPRKQLLLLGKDSAAPEPGLFTRIILYIDDLDRCPTDKVVEVLQAIHLLLYFPLFVVVVAVDARWVSRSLQEEFPQLLAENIIAPRRKRATGPGRGEGEENGKADDKTDGDAAAAKERDADLPAATSHDYLEKIFQIPYWVRPMDQAASMKYVKGIADADVRPGTEQALSEVGARTVGTAPPVAVGSGPTQPQQPQAQQTVATGAQVVGTAPPVAVGSGPMQPQGTQEQAQRGVATGAQVEEETEEQAEYLARSMTLTGSERDFLEALAPFVGSTPRRGLRFVNIYRLVKTSLSEKLQKELVDEKGNPLGYRALMTQLAIVTGAPHVSWSYFQLLGNAAAMIEGRAAPKKEEKPILTLADLRGRLAPELAERDGSQQLALLGALDRLGALNEEEHVDSGRSLLLALDRFAPIARRYSFTARPH